MKTPPFPAEGQSIKAEQLESRIFVPLFAALVLASLILLGFAIHRFDQKMTPKIQFEQQQRIEMQEMKKQAIEDAKP